MITPLVKCRTRCLSTSAASLRSLGVVSFDLSRSVSPRRTTGPSPRFRSEDANYLVNCLLDAKA